MVAICALVVMVVAAPPVEAKREKFAGPVNLAPINPGVTPPASIEFTVRFEKDGKKLKPKSVFPLTERNIYMTCSDGSYVYSTDGASDTEFHVGFSFELFVKKGKFSENDPSSEIEVSGKIERNGTASGTIRMAGRVTPPGYPSLDCDTGVLTWTATAG